MRELSEQEKYDMYIQSNRISRAFTRGMFLGAGIAWLVFSFIIFYIAK